MKLKMKKHCMKFKGGHKYKRGHHGAMFGKVLLLGRIPDEPDHHYGHGFRHHGHGFSHHGPGLQHHGHGPQHHDDGPQHHGHGHHMYKMMKHHFKHRFEEHGFHGCHGRHGFKKHGHYKRGFFILGFDSESDSDDSVCSIQETGTCQRESDAPAPNEDLAGPSAPPEELGESSTSKE